MRILVKYFLRGLLVVIPAAVTLWIVYRVFVFVDGLIRLPLEPWTVPLVGWEVPGNPQDVPGLGFLLTLALITLVGILTSNIVTRRIFVWSERILTRMPVVKLLYGAVRDVIEAFLSEEKKFDKPVVLTLGDGLDVEVIGFVTRESLEEFGLKDAVAVYVPQSYNFAANLLLVPAHRVRPLPDPPAEIMAFVVSGGVVRTAADNAAS